MSAASQRSRSRSRSPKRSIRPRFSHSRPRTSLDRCLCPRREKVKELCHYCQEWERHEMAREAAEAKKKKDKELEMAKEGTQEKPTACECSACDETSDSGLNQVQQCNGCRTWYKTAEKCGDVRQDCFCSKCHQWLCRLCDKENQSLNFESWEDVEELEAIQKDDHLKVCIKESDLSESLDEFVFHCKECLCK